MLDEGLDSGAQAADGHLSAHDGGEAIFENQRRVEILDLQKPFRGLLQSFLGNQAHDFARHGNHAIARRFALHEFEDAMDRRLLEVGEVHRNLGQTADREIRAFDEAQASARKAHGLGNFLGDVDVGRIQKNVVGDESFARADNRRARGRMHAAFAEIRLARGIGGDLGADAFELSAPNVLQILALGRGGGGFIEIDRDLKALRRSPRPRGAPWRRSLRW